MGMGNTLMEIALTGPDTRLLCYVPIHEPLLFVLSIALIPLLCCVYNIHTYIQCKCVYMQCKLCSTCHYCVVYIYSASYTVHTSFILFLQEHRQANHSTYTHTHVLHYCWHKEISRKDPKWPTAIAFCTPQCALHHACLCACHLILKPLMHLHTTPL